MRKRLQNWYFFAILCGCLTIVGRTTASTGAERSTNRSTQQVVIRLKPAANISGRTVQVGDIASIDGGTAGLARRIALLDLEDAPRAGQIVSSSDRQVAFRLQRAGIQRRTFTVQGVKAVVTSRVVTARRDPLPVDRAAVHLAAAKIQSLAKSSVKDAVLAVAEEYVRGRLPWDKESVSIELARAYGPTLEQITTPAHQLNLKPVLQSSWPPVGRVHVGVSIFHESKRIAEVPVTMVVRHFEEVVVAKRQIERGGVVTAEDLYLDRREVSRLNSYYTSIDDVIGKRTGQTIRTLLVIQPSHLTGQNADQPSEIVVRQRDMVTMIARPGGDLYVTAAGQALQNGKVGEMIRVRNVDSNTIILGRVIDRHHVEIPL